jgi:hypothetical protein
MWFPSHLPLEGNEVYLDLLSHNRQLVIPGVWDPDSSPRAFHRVCGRGHSLGGRQIRYSYVTVGTAVGLGGEAMLLEPPWS